MQIFNGSKLTFGQRMDKVQVPVFMHGRVPTNATWFDEMCGGNSFGDNGIVPSTAMVMTGDPGAGKSTLAFTVAAGLTNSHFTIAGNSAAEGLCMLDSTQMNKAQLEQAVENLRVPTENNHSIVLYNSTEESPEQIVMRGQRLRLNRAPLRLADEGEIMDLIFKYDNMIAEERKNGWTGVPVMVLDSVQSMSFDGKASDVSQSKGFATLVGWAKAQKGILFAINQVTGTGKMAGSNKIKHAADFSMHLEVLEEKQAEEMQIIEMQPRFLKTRKNRFGCTGLNWVVSLGAQGFIPVGKEYIGQGT
jgi:predicted ATP-dependent serine protease